MRNRFGPAAVCKWTQFRTRFADPFRKSRYLRCGSATEAETETEEEDHEYTDLLKRARLRRETWRRDELARLKIELEGQSRVKQPVQNPPSDKASRGDIVEIDLRKELAAVTVLEIRTGIVLISQSVNGTSNYVIWKGLRNIISNRKGVMTTLHEGQDLLVPFRPQVIRQEHVRNFLRVGNRDFMSILKDVNANMVHIEEKGVPALILKRSSDLMFAPGAPEPASCSNKFLVKSGTPEKILQFLLFSMTLDTPDDQMVDTGLVQVKERVVTLVLQWVTLYGLLLLDNPAVVLFFEKLSRQVKGYAQLCMLRDYIRARRPILLNNGQWMKNQPSNRRRVFNRPLVWNINQTTQPIRIKDKVLLNVYSQDHSFVSVTMPLHASVEDVMASLKAPAGDRLLVRVQSSGVREQLKMDARAVSFLSINERLFLCSASQAAELTPLQEQLGPKANTNTLENMSAKALAVQLTSYDWELFNAMHETELLYYVLGTKKFPNSPTANLERFIRHFNVVVYWVATEICLCAELSKRARLMRKFIQMASILYHERNMNSFMAVMYGLTNSAVSRLHNTWKKVPKLQLKQFRKYELILDPFSNHGALRKVVAKLDPPYIPYLPLILKAPEQFNSRKLHVISDQRKLTQLSRAIEP
ncbi:rap guanine nucleotide exchange factor 4-like [Sardina pilchardus]|uniref:rap guanine nucleotide exchange factor 4-like n=1 Tax=Sardina pilchardus TaxID=27697 RepID=UPI002E0D928A